LQRILARLRGSQAPYGTNEASELKGSRKLVW
jgi:hypothetical protein